MPDIAEKEKMVEISGRVPESLYDRFVDHLPVHGASSWFVRTAVEAFIDQLDENPSLADQCKLGIQEMLKGLPTE